VPTCDLLMDQGCSASAPQFHGNLHELSHTFSQYRETPERVSTLYAHADVPFHKIFVFDKECYVRKNDITCSNSMEIAFQSSGAPV